MWLSDLPVWLTLHEYTSQGLASRHCQKKLKRESECGQVTKTQYHALVLMGHMTQFMHWPLILFQLKRICQLIFFFFFFNFIYLYLDRGEGWEKERKRNINVRLPLACPLLGTWPETQPCALTGNQTIDPLVHRLAPNPLSHISQGSVKIVFKIETNLQVGEVFNSFPTINPAEESLASVLFVKAFSKVLKSYEVGFF